MRNTNPTEEAKANLVPRQLELSEILVDKDLAKLGDAFVNFTYSLAQSIRNRRGVNTRVPTRILASALKKSGLKRKLPPRTSTHDQADAMEAILVYAWLSEIMTLEEFLSFLSQQKDDSTETFTETLNEILKRLQSKIAGANKVSER